MKIKSRILALLLVVVMCMTTLATTAFAYADDPEDSTIPTEETTATEETEPSDIPPVTETTPATTPVAEAMREAFRFAIEELGVKKIIGDHMAPNAASGAVMRKAGMVQTGIIPGKYEKHGQIHDAICYELSVGEPEALTADEYQKKAMTTLNPALSKHDALLNAVMGLCGESGECIDLVKKHLFQGHELDKEQLRRELGDVAWYLAEAAFALDLSLKEILRGNLDKLRSRYPQGFDPERSMNR